MRTWLPVLLLVAFPLCAVAVEVELWPETYFQLQQYRDVEKLRVDKTRFTQYLTLNLFEESESPHHAFYSSSRADMDFGKDHSRDETRRPLTKESFAILYAYYEWRRIGDTVDMAVGRQVLSDELGIYPIDGARIVVRRDWPFGVELYAGMEVNGRFDAENTDFTWPNSDTHAPDGTETKRRSIGVYGGTFFLDGFDDSELRVQYRHRASEHVEGQNLGLGFRQNIFGLWDIYTTDNYSILFERFSELHFGTGLDFGFIAVSIEHNYSKPEFDAESIFNFFNTYGDKELTAALYAAPDDKTHLNLSYARLHQGDDSPVFNVADIRAWADRNRGSHMIEASGSRRMTTYTDLRLGYQYRYGWGGEVQRFFFGGGTYLGQRRVRLEGDWMGTYHRRLLYTDILEQDRNTGFSWGFRLQSEFRVTEDISFVFNGDVYSNKYIERQFALFSLIDVHTWY